ncbi:IDEAL domain-containing protein [Bacillus timonensis]|nr:IDEAL domain-containing protein [Bacillus timonensis]
MKNEKSYSEIMKTRNMFKKKNEKKSMLDVYIQMILDEAIYLRKKEVLEEKINHAIDTRDKALFMKLSNEFKELNKIAL